MDVKKIVEGSIEFRKDISVNTVDASEQIIPPKAKQLIHADVPESVKGAAEKIFKVAENVRRNSVDLEDFQKIVEQLNESLKNIGIYLAFDKVGELPVVKVKDKSGKVIRTFPPEEVGRILQRINTFFEVLVELIISKKV